MHAKEPRTMKCPVCPDATLLMTDRQGVEVDYCPQCRGVWLDRGELDKLVALGAQQSGAPANASASASAATAAPAAPGYRTPQDRRDFEDSDFGRRHGGHRRKSWLSEIFD
jgi:Zn-finger nucleic acid-binding protein